MCLTQQLRQAASGYFQGKRVGGQTATEEGRETRWPCVGGPRGCGAAWMWAVCGGRAWVRTRAWRAVCCVAVRSGRAGVYARKSVALERQGRPFTQR